MSVFRNLLFVITFTFAKINGNIFFWSNKPFEVPALKYFDDDQLIQLQQNIHENVIAFRGNISQIGLISKLFEKKYTAYVTNGHITINNVVELGNEEMEKVIRDNTKDYDDNYIGVIIDEVIRKRRELPSEEEVKDNNNTPVAYMSTGKEAIVYSSRPLLLTVNSTNYYLGAATVTTLDNRNNYTRLSATILIDDKDKITLRFKFKWLMGYWSFSLIELEYIDLKKYTLSLDNDLIAARNFSYHCSGNTTFTDAENGLELTLYDLQAQPDANKGVFNDAYDCIPFTTVPIWSGIFVVSFLMVVLGIGLNALGNIKITHGCENIKLKELCIAVGNE